MNPLVPSFGYNSPAIYVAAPGGSYETESNTLFAAMSSSPDDTRKGHINTLIASLKSAGVWSKLDILYVIAAGDAHDGRINWKNPGTFDLTAVNSPTFTVDRGYAGNGTTSYLSTGFNPTTAGQQLAQNSFHLSVWSRTAYSGGQAQDIGSYVSVGLLTGWGGAARTLFPNSASTVSNGASGAGLTSSIGRAGPSQEIYVNGASVATGSLSTSTPPNASFFIGTLNFSGSPTQFTTRQFAAAAAGSGLTGSEASDYYNALQTYMTAVGA